MLRLWILVAALAASGCEWFRPKPEFVILSGSENEALAPLLTRQLQAAGVKPRFVYDGSVNIMRAMAAPEAPAADAVWPASSLWLSLGDKAKRVRKANSVFVSPVVLGLKAKEQRALGLFSAAHSMIWFS